MATPEERSPGWPDGADGAGPRPNVITQPHSPKRTVLSRFGKVGSVQEELANPLGPKGFLTEEKFQSRADGWWFPGNTLILPFQENGGLGCSLPTDSLDRSLSYELSFSKTSYPGETSADICHAPPSCLIDLFLCLCHQPSSPAVCGTQSSFSPECRSGCLFKNESERAREATPTLELREGFVIYREPEGG